MSTHACIGKRNHDGTITSIYCHSDGYPEHTGKILAEHYRDAAKLDALLALGDISVLYPEVDPPDGATHNWQERYLNVTVAYGRDRGETGTAARTGGEKLFDVLREFYTYLWIDGEWFIACKSYGPNWEPLTNVLDSLKHQ